MSQEVNTVFRYNGQEYTFDSRDADDMERFENALDVMKEWEAKPRVGKASELQRDQCNMLKRFFDDCLGEGAGEKICTEKSNVSLCYDAYTAFLKMVKIQKQSVDQIVNTYRQYSNRQQRRHPQGGKGKGNRPNPNFHVSNGQK